MEKIPVNIISGFLGSGKTTAIIRLLEQKSTEECWAIVVNEFGKVSIDGQTLRSRSTAGSVFDIAGGCICCSAKSYLHGNLKKITETGRFDRIIIEPSGLGGIEMVSEIVETLPDLELMPTICMVDITGVENPKLHRILIYQSQIHKAGRIVFSKCDLLQEIGLQDQIVKKFKSLFPEKQYCMIGTHLSNAILTKNGQPEIKDQGSKMNFIPAHHLEDTNYREQNFRAGADCIFDIEKLNAFFLENPTIIRAKGHIQTENGWTLFNYSLTGCIIQPCQSKDQNELVIITEKSETDLSSKLKVLTSA